MNRQLSIAAASGATINSVFIEVPPTSKSTISTLGAGKLWHRYSTLWQNNAICSSSPPMDRAIDGKGRA